MVLYTLYVCLLHSCFIENHPIDLEAMDPSFLRWFCHKGVHLEVSECSRSTAREVGAFRCSSKREST
jgi:hypothetical protein